MILSVLAGCSGDGEKAGDFNILLVSIDTLRYDYLNCNGYRERTVSPNIDKIAENGVIFSHAYSPCPWTLPTHASIFTGYYPTSVGLNYVPELDDLREKGLIATATIKKPLAEFLKEKGYDTWAFAGGGFVSKTFGFDRGFDIFYQIPTIKKTGQLAMHQLDKTGENPFFLFLHNFDCHLPYRHDHLAREEGAARILNLFNDLNVPADEPAPWDCLYSEQEVFTDIEKETVKMLYNSSIHLTDQYIGSICEKLKDMGEYDNTLIIILSDHGEEFWDHLNRGAYHGHTLYNELLRVPLIIKLPAGAGPSGGQVIEYPVSLVDIFPTVLDFLDIPQPSDLAGISLKGLLTGESSPPGPRKIYGEAIRSGPERKSVIEGILKLIISQSPDDPRSPEGIKWPVAVQSEIELYNLEDDPAELRNIAAEFPEEVSRLRGILEDFFSKREAEKLIAITKEGETTADSETVDQLRSLGYLN